MAYYISKDKKRNIKIHVNWADFWLFLYHEYNLYVEYLLTLLMKNGKTYDEKAKLKRKIVE